jgi:hypothetical protein
LGNNYYKSRKSARHSVDADMLKFDTLMICVN